MIMRKQKKVFLCFEDEKFFVEHDGQWWMVFLKDNVFMNKLCELLDGWLFSFVKYFSKNMKTKSSRRFE